MIFRTLIGSTSLENTGFCRKITDFENFKENAPQGFPQGAVLHTEFFKCLCTVFTKALKVSSHSSSPTSCMAASCDQKYPDHAENGQNVPTGHLRSPSYILPVAISAYTSYVYISVSAVHIVAKALAPNLPQSMPAILTVVTLLSLWFFLCVCVPQYLMRFIRHITEPRCTTAAQTLFALQL